MKNLNVHFCKKLVSDDAIREYYSHCPQYHVLSKNGKEKGAWIMFSRVNDGNSLPSDIFILTDEELRQFDCYRKASNIHPECFQTIEKQALQKLSKSKNLHELKLVWENFNVTTRLLETVKNHKNILKHKFNSLQI